MALGRRGQKKDRGSYLAGRRVGRGRGLRGLPAAAVTHLDIATIYEVGEADGVVFIVMELVEGKPLRELIGDRAMPMKNALRLAGEIAEGLARAHSGSPGTSG